jgi:hypothetical protein
MRCMAAVGAACLLAAGGAGGAEAPPYAQAPPSPAAPFEVAAIRRNASPDDEGSIGSQPNGRFVVRNVPLRFIIQVVHELPAFRVTGGPNWLDTQRAHHRVEPRLRHRLGGLGLNVPAHARSSAPLAQAPAAPDDSVSVFTSLQEQLGLRPQSERVDTEFLVIDRVERPTED